MEMSRLEAEAYPITSQPGVEPVHTSAMYLNSEKLTMEDVKDRAEAIKANKK
jgi:hypothetical protein